MKFITFNIKLFFGGVMEKRRANTDVTYCTNKKCKFKNICERNIEHYDFNSELLYWFCEFDELECEKRKVSDEEV